MAERAAADRGRLDKDRFDEERPDKERRRNPRFNCGGYVEINWLPSNGIYPDFRHSRLKRL